MPVGISMYISSIDHISEMTMVSVLTPSIRLETNYMGQEAGS